MQAKGQNMLRETCFCMSNSLSRGSQLFCWKDTRNVHTKTLCTTHIHTSTPMRAYLNEPMQHILLKGNTHIITAGDLQSAVYLKNIFFLYFSKIFSLQWICTEEHYYVKSYITVSQRRIIHRANMTDWCHHIQTEHLTLLSNVT